MENQVYCTFVREFGSNRIALYHVMRSGHLSNELTVDALSKRENDLMSRFDIARYEVYSIGYDSQATFESKYPELAPFVLEVDVLT